MRVFILGIGATGSLLAKLLIRQGHQVACGDRDPARARGFLENHPSLSIHQVNARNLHGIVKAARGCHLLVNTCPAALNTVILRAALRLRAHYMDTASHLRQSPFRAEQLHFDRHFRRKHRIALIHAGAAPGLTNVLAIQSAAALETVDKIEIRLFEGTVSDNPVSQWCPDASFDEAVSRPPVYRNGRFLFGKRFGEREVFSFPRPIGRVGVVLAAQDEVVTLPRILRLREMDAKIGGSDTERLRRWHRQGKLNRSRGLVAARFPATLTPYVIAHLVPAWHPAKRPLRGGYLGVWTNAGPAGHGSVGRHLPVSGSAVSPRSVLFSNHMGERTPRRNLCQAFSATRVRRPLA